MNITPASLLLGIGNFKSQALSLLATPGFDFKKDFLSALLSQQDASNISPVDALSPPSLGSRINGLSANGRNMALFDPESAYKMMTVINNRDATYKAQFSEISQMQTFVRHMQDAGQSLSNISLSTENDRIKTQLQGFVDQYNSWIQRFNPDVQKGGMLADTQAAKASMFEMEQSVGNIFNGARGGMHGLRDLGIRIDPHTKLASLDTNVLDGILNTNKQGVVDTIQDFSANFSKSAGLLNASGNFIPRQLNNLSKVLHYVADNKDKLRAEFGTGDPAKPTGQIAQALAIYNQTYSL